MSGNGSLPPIKYTNPALRADAAGAGAVGDRNRRSSSPGDVDRFDRILRTARDSGPTEQPMLDRADRRFERDDSSAGTAGTVNRAADGTVNRAADSTVNRTADSTVNRTADGTVNRAADGTVNRTADSTVNRTADGTVHDTADGTVHNTADGTVNRTADGTVNGTVDRAGDDATPTDGKAPAVVAEINSGTAQAERPGGLDPTPTDGDAGGTRQASETEVILGATGKGESAITDEIEQRSDETDSPAITGNGDETGGGLVDAADSEQAGGPVSNGQDGSGTGDESGAETEQGDRSEATSAAERPAGDAVESGRLEGEISSADKPMNREDESGVAPTDDPRSNTDEETDEQGRGLSASEVMAGAAAVVRPSTIDDQVDTAVDDDGAESPSTTTVANGMTVGPGGAGEPSTGDRSPDREGSPLDIDGATEAAPGVAKSAGDTDPAASPTAERASDQVPPIAAGSTPNNAINPAGQIQTVGQLTGTEPVDGGIDASALAPSEQSDGTDPLWRQVRRALGSLRTTINGEQQLTIRLRPAELGSVIVRISTGESGTAVSLVTESAAAANQLNQQRQQLLSDLKDSGLGSVDVDIDSSAGERSQTEQSDNDNDGGRGGGRAGRSGAEAVDLDMARGYGARRDRRPSMGLIDVDL